MTKRQWVGLLSMLAAAGAAVAQTPVPAERSGTFSIAIPAPVAGGQDVMMYRGAAADAGRPRPVHRLGVQFRGGRSEECAVFRSGGHRDNAASG